MNLSRSIPLSFVFAAFFALPHWADEARAPDEFKLVSPAGETDLSEFVWKKRPILVFADSENDPAYVEQLRLLQTRPDGLTARDVVVLTDTNPEVLSPVRKKLRPRGFMLVILSKEGRVQLRKPFPWSAREISRTIDKLPIRQREIRDSKGNG
ncbi:MAG: DUF4174 domain-containing protein [Paracoccaceae bacterium]